MKIRLMPLAATALAIGALMVAPAMAQVAKPTTAAASNASTPVSTATFNTKAARADLFEIESSKIGVQRAQSAEVRQFATMLVDHHTKASSEFATAVKQSGLKASTVTLSTAHQTKLKNLSKASDSAFDNTYISMQIQAHRDALALHQNYARSGDKAPLKALAQKAVPMMQQHLDEAGRLSTNLPKH